MTECPLHHKLIVDSKGNGHPGNCCDVFHCEMAEETLKHIDKWSNTDQELATDLTLELDMDKPNKDKALKIGTLKAMMRAKLPSIINSPIIEGYQGAPSICTFDKRLFQEGETWHNDPCQVCFCNKGVALCKHMECPKISRNFFLIYCFILKKKIL